MVGDTIMSPKIFTAVARLLGLPTRTLILVLFASKLVWMFWGIMPLLQEDSGHDYEAQPSAQLDVQVGRVGCAQSSNGEARFAGSD
jgi:hypothetical protein